MEPRIHWCRYMALNVKRKKKKKKSHSLWQDLWFRWLKQYWKWWLVWLNGVALCGWHGSPPTTTLCFLLFLAKCPAPEYVFILKYGWYSHLNSSTMRAPQLLGDLGPLWVLCLSRVFSWGFPGGGGTWYPPPTLVLCSPGLLNMQLCHKFLREDWIPMRFLKC